MFSVSLPTTAAALAERLGGRVHGSSDAPVARLGALEGAGPGTLTYCAGGKFKASLRKAEGAVVLATEALLDTALPLTYVIVADPSHAYAQIAEGLRARPHAEGIAPSATVAASAQLAEGVRVGAQAVIEDGVTIGAGTVIGALAYVGRGTTIGRDCEIFPRVTIMDRTVIGDRARILPGAVLGSEGFGLYPTKVGARPMPHIGNVVVGNDVRIGANCTIDRATIGATSIGNGTMIDNLVHVAHNCTVGERVILCGCAALSGSVTLGNDVQLGGQAAVAPGVSVGARAQIGAQAGAGVDIEPGAAYLLSPAIPLRDAMRLIREWRRLSLGKKSVRADEGAGGAA